MLDMKIKWRIEKLWHVIALIVATLVVLPVLLSGYDYPFLPALAAMTYILVMLCHYIFQWRQTPYTEDYRLKFLLLSMTIPVFFLAGFTLSDFNIWFDQKELRDQFGAGRYNNPMTQYVRRATMLISVGCLAGAILMAIRMLRYVWQGRRPG